MLHRKFKEKICVKEVYVIKSLLLKIKFYITIQIQKVTTKLY